MKRKEREGGNRGQCAVEGKHACTSSPFVLRGRHLWSYKRPFQDLFILRIDYLRLFDLRIFIFFVRSGVFFDREKYSGTAIRS